MTIKFICTCGKHLRARDEMAMRRSICPRCGAPVGIPSLQPTHREATLGPMTPAERMRARRNAAASGSLPHDAAAAGTALDANGRPVGSPLHPGGEDPLRHMLREHVVGLVLPRARVPRQLEKHWYECLLYPLRAGGLVLGLAVALTALSGGTLLVLPEIVDLKVRLSGLLILGALFLAIPLVIVGFTCLLLDGALKTAPVGQLHIHWLGRNLGLAIQSGASWLFCFLAGPVVPLGGSVIYWFYCGDPIFPDWLILAYLSIVGISYGLFATLAVNQSGRLLDANPVRIAELACKLGFRSIAVVVVTATLMLGHCLLAFAALQALRHDAGVGWTLLFFCWLNGMFWVAFLLRLLGVWCQRAKL